MTPVGVFFICQNEDKCHFVNSTIISRNGVMPDFLCLLNQKGREINAVARAFNSGYGTAEELRQALDCLKDIAQAAYEVRKEGFTHAP